MDDGQELAMQSNVTQVRSEFQVAYLGWESGGSVVIKAWLWVGRECVRPGQVFCHLHPSGISSCTGKESPTADFWRYELFGILFGCV